MEGTLRCAARHHFPISGGVPRLVERLKYPKGHAATRDSFSAKWSRYGNVAWDSKAYVDFQRKWFLERYGLRDTEGIARLLAGSKLVLDAGCGVGMAVEWLHDGSSSELVGVDIGDAVDVAFARVGRLPRVHIVQGDIANLPFGRGTFDYISCDQVIHHTIDPPATFAHLATRLSARGGIGIYAYRRKGPVREFCDDFLRERTTRMSVDECVEFSATITEFGRALARAKTKVTIPVDLPLLGISKGTHDIQRLWYWHVFKCFWNEEMGWDVSLATNLDWYHPRHAHRYAMEDLENWFKRSGISLVNTHATESGYTLRGRRNAAARVKERQRPRRGRSARLSATQRA